MRFAFAALGLALLCGCSSAPAPPARTEAPPVAVKDSSGMLPLKDRISTAVVPNHLLGQQKLPGGTVGDYASGGRKYQLFVIEATSSQDAAFLLLDIRGTLREPQYIAYMGGYFGSDGTRPVYAFAKLRYLAGVVGLPKDDADPIARVLAARLK